ncbi:MAG: hypothetical protein CSA66_05050 [Proteobacteria bacterium]|nr:MAG: hypothetical protein CSA66_05050 [Pseudomonadota bacterium]
MNTPSFYDRRGNAAVIIIGVVAVAAIAFAVYWFALRGGGGEASKLVSGFVPVEADFVGGVDVDGVVKSELIKGIAASQGVKLDAVKAKLAERGLDLDTLKTLAFGADAPEGGQMPTDFVAVATGTFDATALKGAMATAKVAAAAKGVKGLDLSNLEVLDSGLVIGGSGSLLDKSKALAGGSGRSADDNADLKAVRGAINEGATFWIAGPIPADVPLDGLDMMGSLGTKVGKPTHFAISADASNKLELEVAVRFDGEVSDMVNQLEGMLSMAKAFASGPQGEVLDSLDLGGSGQILRASLRLSQAAIETLAKQDGEGGLMPF